MQEHKDSHTRVAGTLRLRAGLTLLPLDDEMVVFSEASQRLVGLNASAAFVFRRLQTDAAVPELAHALASEGLARPDEAEHWVMMALDSLSSHGMLDGGPTLAALPTERQQGEGAGLTFQVARMPPYAPVRAIAERRYRLLETCALIRCANKAQMRLVDAVIGHLATDADAAPDIVIEIQRTKLANGQLRSDIYRDGIPIGYAPRLSALAPLVKAALWQSAVRAHDFLFYIHAGVVGAGQSCILFPAAAGSGKSSLTAALTHAGFRYFSDEVALIQRGTFKVPPLSLAICVKGSGWELMARYYPDLWALPTHRREDGKMVRYIPPPAGAAQQPPASVSHIIFPRHGKDAPTELKRIGRSEALGRLLGECLGLGQRLDQNNVGELVSWIAGIDCYGLTFSSLEEAVDLVKQTVESKNINQNNI